MKKLINTLKSISYETSDSPNWVRKRAAPHTLMKPYPEHHTTLGEEVVRRYLTKEPYRKLLTRFVTSCHLLAGLECKTAPTLGRCFAKRSQSRKGKNISLDNGNVTGFLYVMRYKCQKWQQPLPQVYKERIKWEF